MRRLARAALQCWRRAPFAELVRLADSGERGGTSVEGDCTTVVVCVFDAPPSRDVVRILAITNRGTLFSSMFPQVETARVARLSD